MNCHAHTVDPRSLRAARLLGSHAHVSNARRTETSRPGHPFGRIKDALYELVDLTARERFEARKPCF
jgi:hypothetical protein